MLKEVELFKEIMKKTFKKVPFISKKDVRHLKTINECHHICNKKHFDKYIIVRYHFHVKIKYGGSTHQICNDVFRLTKEMSIVFHNLKGYNGYIIMQENSEFKHRCFVISRCI